MVSSELENLKSRYFGIVGRYLFDHGMWQNHRKRRRHPSGFKRLPFFHSLSLKPPEEVFQADEVACQMRCANGDSHSGFHGLSWLFRTSYLAANCCMLNPILHDRISVIWQTWCCSLGWTWKLMSISYTLYIFTHVAVKDKYSSCLTTLIMYLHCFRYFHSCLVACY